MPQPVYATGPQVKTDECQRIVTSLVTLQCMNANNCIGVELGDIRPAIMLQLSRMSGGNYATACAGYLDGIFNDYVSQFANAAPNGTPSKFPTPVAPNTNANGNQIQLNNPFATPAPDWATDMRERQLELQALHTETGTNNHQIQSADFPATYADVSFTDRLENARNGYEPFKDAHAYREMDIEDEETYLARIERSKPTKKCTEKTCNIDYVLNGGTKADNSPESHTTCSGNDTTLEDPSRTGHTFGGWYTKEDFSGDKKRKIIDEDCKNNGDKIKLYAKWTAQSTPCTPKKCTITYELDGGTNHDENPDEFTTCGNPVTLKNPTKTDYTFNGWYTDNNLTNKITQITNCPETGDINLYPKWDRTTPIDECANITLTASKDSGGSYGVLFQPGNSRFDIDDSYEKNDVNNNKFWVSEHCSVNSLVTLNNDKNTAINVGAKEILGNSYNYFLHLSNGDGTYGMLNAQWRGNSWGVVRFNTLDEAKCAAKKLAAKVKSESCWRTKKIMIHAYVVTLTGNKADKIKSNAYLGYEP